MGLFPNDVLDLNMGQYQAALEGYSLRQIDDHILAIHTGYWVGYYNNAKRPKSPSVMAKKLRKSSDNKKSGTLTKPDVDVEGFLQKEKEFEKRRKRVALNDGRT